MTIDGRQYILTPRRASDVLNLVVAVEKNEKPDNVSNLLTIAQIVRDSLKATYLSFGKIRGWRYRQFLGSAGIILILDSLSTEELMNAYQSVMELEGSKKKQSG